MHGNVVASTHFYSSVGLESFLSVCSLFVLFLILATVGHAGGTEISTAPGISLLSAIKARSHQIHAAPEAQALRL